MILNEMSKLNSKLFEKIKPRKQANELPKSDEHSDKLINQLNHCKTMADLCESFDYYSYISQEESLICNICHKPFSRWLSHPWTLYLSYQK